MGEYFFASSHIMAMIDSDEKLTYQKGKDDFIKSFKHPGMGRNDIYWVDAKIIDDYRIN